MHCDDNVNVQAVYAGMHDARECGTLLLLGCAWPALSNCAIYVCSIYDGVN